MSTDLSKGTGGLEKRIVEAFDNDKMATTAVGEKSTASQIFAGAMLIETC